MLSKLENAKITLEDNVKIMHCPLCFSNLKVLDNSLVCEQNHNFNISKKGIISLATPLNDKIYTDELFKTRHQVLQTSVYEQILKHLLSKIEDNDKYVVDLGCGEGSYLDYLKSNQVSNHYLGIDLSKPGLNIASNVNGITWLLADLSNTPIKDNSVDYILNILSPANYKEMNRILSDDGTLIKVIVEEDYLKELREKSNLKEHNNDQVIKLLSENMDIVEHKQLTYTIDVNFEVASNIKLMSPLMAHRDFDEDIDKITIDLSIIVCKKKEL